MVRAVESGLATRPNCAEDPRRRRHWGATGPRRDDVLRHIRLAARPAGAPACPSASGQAIRLRRAAVHSSRIQGTEGTATGSILNGGTGRHRRADRAAGGGRRDAQLRNRRRGVADSEGRSRARAKRPGRRRAHGAMIRNPAGTVIPRLGRWDQTSPRIAWFAAARPRRMPRPGRQRCR